jgi:nitrite reductase (NO-forming)/hydroxylamine reductase
MALFAVILAVGLICLPGDGTAQNNGKLTEKEMAEASQIYFDRCAGCHGTTRKGATGPDLLPDRMKKLGTDVLKIFITEGTTGGMPDWGKQGIMTEEEIDLTARFIQEEPPAPPEFSMDAIKATWKLAMAPDKRPTEPQHDMNWQNFMGVILRDVGKVAIIDGDTHKLVNVVNTGFAVHILRTSKSGRYLYSVGRDGKVTMIDLWLKVPDMVAEIKTCFDARSLDTSKYNGPLGDFTDKYIVVGGYWPPSMIILDGQTLEPITLFSTSGYTYDTNEYLREARVASIVSSHHDPLWVVNIKETGYVLLVDYTNIDAVKITNIKAERFLHDGGWDSTQRYFLVAANMRDTISVVDTVEKKLVANVIVGTKPHPGRGANFVHPEYGPLWVTGHLGDNRLACIGTDPEGHPDYAWKVAAWLELPDEGGGNLFVKTHPESKWIWADRPLHPNVTFQRSVFVFSKETLKLEKRLEIPEKYQGVRAVHLEYNMAGDEVWVSVWGNKDEPTAMLVYDDKTLELKKEITGDWCRTPTGHFNIFNTMKDKY